MEAMIKGNCIRITLKEAENNIAFTMPDGNEYNVITSDQFK